jgi:hypothetical protein
MPYWMIAIYTPNSIFPITILHLSRGEAEGLARFIWTNEPSFKCEVIAHA